MACLWHNHPKERGESVHHTMEAFQSRASLTPLILSTTLRHPESVIQNKPYSELLLPSDFVRYRVAYVPSALS